jgi:protocatechuate 3,4-dioxygenase beta subunit
MRARNLRYGRRGRRGLRADWDARVRVAGRQHWKYDEAGLRPARRATDVSGVWQIDTIVPGAWGARRIWNIKVQAAGKPTLATQLFLPTILATRDKVFRQNSR